MLHDCRLFQTNAAMVLSGSPVHVTRQLLPDRTKKTIHMLPASLHVELNNMILHLPVLWAQVYALLLLLLAAHAPPAAAQELLLCCSHGPLLIVL
jgi:hypothetical protein